MMEDSELRSSTSLLSQLDLREVRLKREALIGERGLRALAERCIAIERVSLQRCTAVDDAGLATLARYCSRLKSLCIDGCAVSDRGIVALCQTRGGALLELSVRDCTKLTDRAFCGIGSVSVCCTALRVLDISDCDQLALSDATFEALSLLTALRDLRLAYCDQASITDRAYAAIGRISSLTALDVEGAAHEALSEAVVHAVSRLSSLQTLRMNDWIYCAEWRATALCPLAALRNLERLELRGCPARALSLQACAALSSLDRLVSLHLFSDAAADDFASTAVSIQFLRLPRTLREVALHGALSEPLVQMLEQLPQLQLVCIVCLCVWRSRISDTLHRLSARPALSAIQLRILPFERHSCGSLSESAPSVLLRRRSRSAPCGCHREIDEAVAACRARFPRVLISRAELPLVADQQRD
jgi:hypothetical protein